MATVSEHPTSSDLPSQPSQDGDHEQPSAASADAFAVEQEDHRPNWGVIIWLVIMHLGALAAPFFFSWEGVILMFALHWFTGGIGICLGFHRLLTHTSFKTFAPLRYTIAMIGQLAGEGSAIDWVSSHRKHHALSDQEGDPHSPRDGALWSHILWLAHSIYGRNQTEHTYRWAPDLAKDPVMNYLGKWAITGHFIFGGLIFLSGYLWGEFVSTTYSGTYMGWSFLMWGVFARLTFVLHSTWLVNSASHMWGYTNYETTDDSRNNWFVALLTYGEGWHNNHHAYPRMANHGHKWWEFDLTFRTIRLMERLGLAWDVVDYKQRSRSDTPTAA